MNDVIGRIKDRIDVLHEIADSQPDGAEYGDLIDTLGQIEEIIRDEESARQLDIPVQCINGCCPIALADEYEDRGMDVIHSCNECQYKTKEPVCEWKKWHNGAYSTCGNSLTVHTDYQAYKYCPYCGKRIEVVE